MDSHGMVRTLREQIVSRLRQDILSGQLEEGEALREEDLARRFGVSRGPVRDALLQLTKEGLLVAKPYCGVRVADAPSEAVRELVLKLRRQVEVYALELAFATLTDDRLESLREILEILRQACDNNEQARAIEADISFHRWIVESSGETDLLALWLPIVTRMRLEYSRHQSLKEVYPEHKRIFEAIRRRDLKKAVRYLEANIV